MGSAEEDNAADVVQDDRVVLILFVSKNNGLVSIMVSLPVSGQGRLRTIPA